MPTEIRAATLADVPVIVELLLQDAQNRRAHNPILWELANDGQDKVEETLKLNLSADNQPFREKWLVAANNKTLVGIIHSVLLPVPPIYGGKWGEPGLIMPECFVTQDAPLDTILALIDAAEADLRRAGAELLLASFVSGDAWRACFEERGYRPITLYLAKDVLEGATAPRDVRAASEEDIEEIVRRSAEHRKILFGLDAFWTPHAEADNRFRNWMKKSLTLQDRDMFVAGSLNALSGYVIAQPASRLHIPAAHDVSNIGVIDDYFHRNFSDPTKMQDGAEGAMSLLQAAETAFLRRGVKAALVVCPAAWTSKISILEGAGYETGLMWMIKR